MLLVSIADFTGLTIITLIITHIIHMHYIDDITQIPIERLMSL